MIFERPLNGGNIQSEIDDVRRQFDVRYCRCRYHCYRCRMRSRKRDSIGVFCGKDARNTTDTIIKWIRIMCHRQMD